MGNDPSRSVCHAVPALYASPTGRMAWHSKSVTGGTGGTLMGVKPALPALWREMRRFIGPAVAWLAPSFGYGLERFPLAGGAVIAANHLSAIDHPLVGLLSPRPVHFMSKAELIAAPIVGTALRL